MNRNQFENLQKLFHLLVKNDDLMTQTTLFEAQQLCSNMLLDACSNPARETQRRTRELLAAFPQHFKLS